MKIERIKNAKRNMVWGMCTKITTLLIPFILRTILIKTLGAEYLGLNSLFTSILSVLNMTELGFSSAIIFSMYKPIAEDDYETICALINYYRRIYQIIGTIILVVGICLIPFLPRLINGSYPEGINIVALYVIQLSATVISYFLFAYKSSLMSAYQREDITSSILLIANVIQYAAQIIVLMTNRNYYLYIGVTVFTSILNNLIIEIVSRRIFPNVVCKGDISDEQRKDIKVKVSGLMLTKIMQTSRNSFDSIFVSCFLGLTITAMYNNYYYVMSSVIILLSTITSSVLAGIGNSVAMESIEKNYNDMNQMNFFYMILSGWCMICMLCLYQPFMKLWMGRNLMFDLPVVILFCIYFYILKMGDIRSIYLEANGLWWENRYKTILEGIANIVLNYLLGKYFGIYGIILSTILSLFFINFCYGTQIVYRHYFKGRKLSLYFLTHARYALVTAGIATFTYFVCSKINLEGILGLIFKAVICMLLPAILYFLIYYKTKIFKESTLLLQKILPTKLSEFMDLS